MDRTRNPIGTRGLRSLGVSGAAQALSDDAGLEASGATVHLEEEGVITVSDHFSGPRAVAGPAGDICDLYAFPSPSQPGRIVLVMTVHPSATSDTLFSDAITYRFRLRPVGVPGDGGRTRFTVGEEGDEVAFTLTFEPPSPGGGTAAVQTGRCAVSTSGATIAVAVNDPSGAHSDGVGVYAGLRSDPFFVDAPALLSMMDGRLAFSDPGTNSLEGRNVLGVVVEADHAPLLAAGRGPLFAVAAETVVSGPLPIRLERVGRPEIKNVMLSPKKNDPVNSDIELRDLYNLEDPFHVGREYRGAYRTRLDSNLRAYDRLDGKADWPTTEDDAHPLTELVLDDHLVVDVSKPFTENSFLEIEQSMLAGRPHTSWGGRSLNHDVMDTLYALLITAGHGPPVSHHVHSATTPASADFPYLAPPVDARTERGRTAAEA